MAPAADVSASTRAAATHFAPASSSVAEDQIRPVVHERDDAAIVEVELLGLAPQGGRGGAGDGQRAQQFACP